MTGTAGRGLESEGREGVAHSGLPVEQHHSKLEAFFAELVLIPSNLHMDSPRHPKGGSILLAYTLLKLSQIKYFLLGENQKCINLKGETNATLPPF